MACFWENKLTHRSGRKSKSEKGPAVPNPPIVMRAPFAAYIWARREQLESENFHGDNKRCEQCIQCHKSTDWGDDGTTI
jgi:hypothetical protein